MSNVKYVDGAWVFDGDTFTWITNEADLTYIRDELQLFSDDIAVVTYPKAGTTWMQEIVWSIQHGPGSADTREKGLDVVFPFLEMNLFGLNGLELVKSQSRPRFMKSHLKSTFFKRQLEGETNRCPKFIIVIRNPKDVLLSYYNFHKMFKKPFLGTWDEFFQLAQEKRLASGDYFDHVVSWMKYRDHPNVHFVQYEDLKEDAATHIQGIAEFLGTPLTQGAVDAIVEDTSFATMRARPVDKYFTARRKAYGNFFRQGQVGSWRDVFSEDQEKYVNEQVATHFHPVGIEYD